MKYIVSTYEVHKCDIAVEAIDETEALEKVSNFIIEYDIDDKFTCDKDANIFVIFPPEYDYGLETDSWKVEKISEEVWEYYVHYGELEDE